ncbi:MAG: flagellar basal body protein, partial [Defluviitaleaceae bacterium]|nr:flagellar basal body protein [Defluviitaleaceae bacterium]
MPLHSIHRGVSGLQAAQRNLAVTGHNMANVSTQGFSRQRVNQMTFAYNNIGRTASTTNQVGLGTDIAGIQQLRHQFTDIRYRMEVGRANFYTTMHSNSLALEVTMSELTRVGEGTSGIIATNRLWNSLQELSMNPSGMDTRSNFISAARSYINRMNDTHRRLIEQQQDLNGQVITMVDDVNSLVQTIREMNFRINLEEASGQAANDFRDTRNLAMDRLVALLDVEFRSNPINGHVNIMANGHPLLSDGLVFHVGLRFTEPGSSFVEPVVGLHLQPGDPTLLFDPTFSNAHALLRLDRPPMDIDRPGSIMGTVMARGLFAANHASQYQRIGFIFTGVTATNPSGFTVPPPGTAPTHIHDGRGNFLAENVDLTPQQFARALQHQEARMAFNANYTVIPRTIRHLDTAFNHLITMLNEMFTNQNANINDPSQWGGADPATWVNSANPGDHTLNLSNTAG